MHRFVKTGLAAFCALALLTAGGLMPEAEAAKAEGLTATEAAADMGEGWNLGNSLDSYANGQANETAWANPVITKELIRAVKAAGFKTIRIPVTYIGHVGNAPDYTIDPAWLGRVKEVVDYAYRQDLYVVINIHHDGGGDWKGGAWLNCEAADQRPVQAKYHKIWEQLAREFKDYDQHLIFESMNEIHEEGNWGDPKSPQPMKNINAYNQIFVDTVRQGSTANQDRILVVPGYNTNVGYTVNPSFGFQLPKDSADKKLMVSVHYYDPYNFTLDSGSSNVWAWGREAIANGVSSVNWHQEDTVDKAMTSLQDSFAGKGVPFFVGEYGAIDKAYEAADNRKYREHWYQYVTKEIRRAGGVPVVWDNGCADKDTFTFIDRRSDTPADQGLLDAVMSGYEQGSAESTIH